MCKNKASESYGISDRIDNDLVFKACKHCLNGLVAGAMPHDNFFQFKALQMLHDGVQLFAARFDKVQPPHNRVNLFLAGDVTHMIQGIDNAPMAAPQNNNQPLAGFQD